MAFETRTTLPGSETVQRTGLQFDGPFSGDRELQVSVILRRRTDVVSLLERMGELLHLSHSQHAEQHGGTDADVRLVEEFAHEAGLTVVEGSAAKRRVILSGTAAELRAAFGADLVYYRESASGQRFLGRQGKLSIPTELKGIVTAVLGFDTRPVAVPHFRNAEDEGGVAAPRQTAGTFTPQQVAALYSFPTNVTGKGQTIAIIELGGGYRTADIKAYFTALKLQVPSVTAISVDGGKNTPGSDADSEVMLDIEVAGAVANGANLAVYFAPNTDQGFVDAITQAVHDTKRKPSVISISWGGPEDSWSQQARDAMNSALQDAATLGVTVTAASGDNGSSDGATDGKLHVDFPASSPFALACGGTTLRGAGTTISSETVWNETAQKSGATGGGISNFFALPAYQKSVSVPKQPETNFVGRGVPDIAGDADPVTGYQVRVNGQNVVVGGTSAVAPLWAGLVALMNQQLGTPVGFLNPKLYSLAGSTGFHDITSGNNDDSNKGYYKAAKGWDPCTGLGTPNGTALLKNLAATAGKQRAILPGSAPEHSADSKWSAVPDTGTHPVSATIILRHTGVDNAQQLLSGTAPALPHGEASTVTGASPQAIEQVRRFAAEHGLEVTEANAATRTVKVRGSIEQMQSAFGVSLGMVSHNDGAQHLSHSGSIAIPPALAGVITAVLGLDQRPIARHHETTTKTAGA